jgi:hypothetical protein
MNKLNRLLTASPAEFAAMFGEAASAVNAKAAEGQAAAASDRPSNNPPGIASPSTPTNETGCR